MEGVHDLGGLGGFGPVVTDDGELTYHESWEPRAQVLAVLGLMGTSVRRYIEGLDPEIYLTSPYYVRWLRAAEAGTVAKGRLSRADLDRWRAAVEQGEPVPERRDPDVAAVIAKVLTERQAPMPAATAPRFARGDAVVVRRMWDDQHHHRCPRYVRGVTGVIDAVCGDGRAPDGDRQGDLEPEYTVAFSSIDVWGDTGEPAFRVYVDLYEHYLEPA